MRLHRKTEKPDGDGGWTDIGFDGFFDDAFAAVLIGIAVIVVVFLAVTVVFPIVVIGLEILILIVLAVGGFAGRMLFGKPWTVRARSNRGMTLVWRARGFRRSGRVRDDAAAALAAGEPSPRPAEAEVQ